jgi:hypothetical protein
VIILKEIACVYEDGRRKCITSFCTRAQQICTDKRVLNWAQYNYTSVNCKVYNIHLNTQLKTEGWEG